MLRKEIASRGLGDQVLVTVCGSFGLCERGPNMIVYPDGVWYSGVGPNEVREIVESHFQQGKVVERLANTDVAALGTEIRGNRDRMVAAMRAKDASGALPDPLLATIRGFQESRVILTAIELDIFTAVGAGATAGDVAAHLGTDARATEMLLNALTAMELLTKQSGTFQNTPATARYFVCGSPNDARAAMMHTVHLWDTWSDLTECVRIGTSIESHGVKERGADWVDAFIAAMDHNASQRAPLVVEAIGTEGVRRMLDVGGGSAAYSLAFARSNPALHVEVLDLPGVLPLTRSYIDKAGLGDRVTTRPGDLTQDALGEGYDLVLVSAICHMLSPEENLDLLRRCRAALAAGGRAVIQDFLLESDKTAPKSAALFALNMLVGTRAGSSYSIDEYAEWLREAGFSQTKHLRLPGPSGLMVGAV